MPDKVACPRTLGACHQHPHDGTLAHCWLRRPVNLPLRSQTIAPATWMWPKFGGMNELGLERGPRLPAMLLELVLRTVHDVVLVTEAEPITQEAGGPRVVYVNAAFTAMTGYTADEIVAEHLGSCRARTPTGPSWTGCGQHWRGGNRPR